MRFRGTKVFDALTRILAFHMHVSEHLLIVECASTEEFDTQEHPDRIFISITATFSRIAHCFLMIDDLRIHVFPSALRR